MVGRVDHFTTDTTTHSTIALFFTNKETTKNEPLNNKKALDAFKLTYCEGFYYHMEHILISYNFRMSYSIKGQDFLLEEISPGDTSSEDGEGVVVVGESEGQSVTRGYSMSMSDITADRLYDEAGKEEPLTINNELQNPPKFMRG